MTANIHTFPQQELFVKTKIRLDLLPSFLENQKEWIFSGNEDRQNDFNWLNENIPNWNIITKEGELDLNDPEVNENVIGMFKDIKVFILFSNIQERESWRKYQKEKIQKAEKLALDIEKAQKEFPEGSTICQKCAELMEDYSHKEILRIAQIAFIETHKGHKCPKCNHTQVDIDPEREIYDIAINHVGLPTPGSPEWNSNVAIEWEKRRHLPPEVIVYISEETTKEDIIQQINEFNIEEKV